MNIFDVLTLLGGLAMFLYGMRLMGDSLKENSSATLKAAMERVTNNPLKAFLMGLLVTALIQSSTATIVITSGLVGAGILTLHQSLGIIIGANVGTTVTGQIIRLLDLNTSAGGGAEWLRFFQPSTLAPIALILGMSLIMGGHRRGKSMGSIAIGFGILFTGLLQMTGSVGTLAQSGMVEKLFTGLDNNPLLGYVTGAGVAFVLQSSSATVGILQAFSATGLMRFKGIYAVIVGIYLGDCVTTAIVCSIGAKKDARRVGIVNILYNLGKTALVLVFVTLIHNLGFLTRIWDAPVNSTIIANTNTIFNLTCAVLLLPMVGVFERLSMKIVREEEEKPQEDDQYKERIDALSPAFFQTPALALRSCYDLLVSMLEAAKENLHTAYALLETYSQESFSDVEQREDAIDRMTDNLSRYMVELLAHLHPDYHLGILNQYYKVSTEFESLGDQALHIAEQAQNLHKNSTSFSPMAKYEISVLWKLIQRIITLTEETFVRRDLLTAQQIEPLTQVAQDVMTQMRKNHFQRMGSGQCSLFADACFSNLLGECKRIADVCSNVGIATIVRIRPELADHEHSYFEQMHSGSNEAFNRAYATMHQEYFKELSEIPQETLDAMAARLPKETVTAQNGKEEAEA